MSARTQDRYPEAFAALARSLAEVSGVRLNIEQIVARSVQMVPCDWAATAVTEQLTDRPAGLAAVTDPDLMATVAQIAGRCAASPGRTAFSEASMVYCPDLAADSDWVEYSTSMVAQTPIRSVLSFGLRLHDHPLGVLTSYAERIDAFDHDARRRGRLLADHATIAIDAATSADAAVRLKSALATNRVIGAAMGMLVERLKVSPDEAFDLLRVVSNHTNRKLLDVAEELLRTGHRPQPPPSIRSQTDRELATGDHAPGATTPPEHTA